MSKPSKKFDKKNAKTYHLVHRARDDPLYYDDEASANVLVEAAPLNTKQQKDIRRTRWKGKTMQELENDADDFKTQGMRENEGEAALYGIAFDDSKYDYMQHLKPIGEHPDAVFISRHGPSIKGKKDGELPLRYDYAKANHVDYKVEMGDSSAKNQLPTDALPSQDLLNLTYQNMQNVPDAIAGFQPDMDPALREVLEALEDEAYIADDEDDEEDDFIADIVKGKNGGEGDELNDYDNQAIPDSAYGATELTVDDADEHDWEAEFRKFKISQKDNGYANSDIFSSDEDEDGLGDLPSFNKNQKGKKKGKKFSSASSDATGFSMSSSAIFRNEGLTLLDDRFDQIEKQYEDDEEEEDEQPQEFDMAKERPDLESIMDDFLDNYVVEGKKMYKKLK